MKYREKHQKYTGLVQGMLWSEKYSSRIIGIKSWLKWELKILENCFARATIFSESYDRFTLNV